MAGVVLGVVADDFTGATDVASMLVRHGMRTVQCIGVPEGDAAFDGFDAVVVALKSRTAAVADAVAASRAAWQRLAAAGARQCYFKVCSTFDSTPRGNIGPVAEALLADTGADVALVCPAFPENGRTVFRGHLFVGDELLSDSGMRRHPLTPMTDSNLVRWLQPQCATRRVGLVRYDVVARGADAVRARIAALRAQGVALAVADALHDADLRVLGDVAADHALLVAGSGVALGLPAAYRARGWWQPHADAAALEPAGGAAAVVAGSCSTATNAQVAAWRAAGRPAFAVDALALAGGRPVVDAALSWARAQAGEALLIHATVAPDELKRVQVALGVERAGALVEDALARIAAGLVDGGVRRLVVAGGETSGAVVQALGVQRLRIGAAICPGVPWTQAEGRPLWLALKSGNFGGTTFFADAIEVSR